MLSQRVRGAENRAKHRLANGPLRVRSNGNFPGVFRNVRHALNVGDMSVSCKVHGLPMNQGGTADKFIRPWQIFFLPRTFLFLSEVLL